MPRILSRWAVLSIGVIFHVIYVMSIFDIYFISPLVHGMRHFSPSNPSPAKRLVFLVGDGLRADKFFDPQIYPSKDSLESQDFEEIKNQTLAPYLIGKILSGEALTSVSHTRVPTESRPGHVALIAGFYEDVSAVTKGWQMNPVDFDSVFNQSAHTWSFGSPDILPMFSEGADPGRVDADYYDASFEDFTKSSTDLDKYSFDHFSELLNSSKTNSTLNAQLHQDGNVFFLHLLGIDSAGHAKRPNSAEYYDNIKFVDSQIKELEKKVNDYFKDEDTVFIFTADHGMSDLGSHGDGHPQNTRTPLVAWGKGIAAVSESVEKRNNDNSEYGKKSGTTISNKELVHLAKDDVAQADISMLMSFLLNLNYPANSVGELPVQFLDASIETKTKALFANAMSISEQYLVKESHVAPSQLSFTPYTMLSGNMSVSSRRQEIESLIAKEKWEEAFQRSEDLIAEGLRGMRYLQQYNWILLKSIVTMGFLGFIGFALSSFFSQFIAPEIGPIYSTWSSSFFLLALSILFSVLKKQKSPINYYFYAFFPVLFWFIVFSYRNTWKLGVARFFNGPQARSLNLSFRDIFTIIGGLILIELMVCGYFHRELFSLLLVFVYMPWPWVTHFKASVEHWFASLLWSVSCFSLAICGLCPVNKTENLQLITYSGILMALISFAYTIYLSTELWMSTVTMVTVGFQISLIVLSVLVTRVSVNSMNANLGLPIGSQLIGWMTLLFSALVPFMHSLTPIRDYRFRLLNVFMMFSPAMVILSISYEGFFYVAFVLMMYSWLLQETLVFSHDSYVNLKTYRMAIWFIMFTHVAFFATGNIASISSFSLDSVYRLIPVFNPFSMGALLIFKILIPFVLLSVFLGIINMKIGLPRFSLFSMVLAISDILSLNFFYLVVDEGSWLDIGTGISHFCICSMLCLFLSLIEYLSTALVSDVTVSDGK
ncbi:mannose-ethanolamine phosphotransferase [Starmerella bacillaris]|uniref:GPI ethanolamine phosphate transferase 1 n=1 Tax=Starmerella bacillaris TaxID=1247836 RepID=A0AAV5RKF8_STABA|nr:mannose-ethanolamine phosphotransferase [Starmerella bacillaris]